uniref:Uncharacterized protein n=1 Tax=Alexandrium andersonii TaxID=327968 RepID=A0A7S2FU26_9DINO
MAHPAMSTILCLAACVAVAATKNHTGVGNQSAGSNHSVRVEGPDSVHLSIGIYDTMEELVESPGAMLRGGVNASSEMNVQMNATLSGGAPNTEMGPAAGVASDADAFVAANVSSLAVASKSSCYRTCNQYCSGGNFLSWCRRSSCYCQCGRSTRVGSCGGTGLFCKHQCALSAKWATYSWCMSEQCWCYQRSMQVVGRC